MLLVIFHCLTVSRPKNHSRQIGSISMFSRNKLTTWLVKYFFVVTNRCMFWYQEKAVRHNGPVPSFSVVSRCVSRLRTSLARQLLEQEDFPRVSSPRYMDRRIERSHKLSCHGCRTWAGRRVRSTRDTTAPARRDRKRTQHNQAEHHAR